MTNDLKNFLDGEIQGFKPPYSYSEVEEILEKYNNFVLDLVEKEVGVVVRDVEPGGELELTLRKVILCQCKRCKSIKMI